MAYFSIKEMLQKSLNIVFRQISTPRGDFPAESPAEQNPALAGPLHLRRLPYPVEYLSPLPLRLAAQCGQPPPVLLSEVEARLLHLWQQTPPLALPLPWQPLLSSIQLQPHASGQLVLQLGETALTTWLEGLGQEQSWPKQPAKDFPPTLAMADFPLSGALALSPVALVQYTHARCWRLLAERWHPKACLDDTRDVHNRRGGIATSLPTQPLLWHLVSLVDTLPEGPPPQTLLRQGCQLAAAVDLWLQYLPQPTTLPGRTVGLLLQGLQQTLQHLLTDCLGIVAPTDL